MNCNGYRRARAGASSATRSSACSRTLLRLPPEREACPNNVPPDDLHPVIKQTPSFGRIFAMVAFTLSCFGILVFLWLNFGGSVPLQPEGYRITRGLPVGDAARQGGGRAHLRRARGQGQDAASRTSRPGSRTRCSRSTPLRADPEGLARDPAPEVAAGRDVRGALARHALVGDRCTTAGSCRRARSPTRSSSTRSCGASTRRRARASRSGSTRPGSRRRATPSR